MNEEDTSSIQTMIQTDPMVRVYVALRTSSNSVIEGLEYWWSWCFSDHPGIKSFMGSSALTRAKAQRIHDGIVREVTRKLQELDAPTQPNPTGTK